MGAGQHRHQPRLSEPQPRQRGVVLQLRSPATSSRCATPAASRCSCGRTATGACRGSVGPGLRGFADRADAGRRLAGALKAYRDRDVLVLACRAAVSRWRSRWPRPSTRRWTCWWCASSVCRISPNSRSGRSARTGCGCSTTRCCGTLLTDAEMARWRPPSAPSCSAGSSVIALAGERVSLRGRVVLIVDDGFATGATARAACLVARARAPPRWCWPRRSARPTPSPH